MTKRVTQQTSKSPNKADTALRQARAGADTEPSASTSVSDRDLAVRRLALVQGLVSGKSLRAAARDAGVAYSTARYWLGDEKFKEQFRTACREAYEQALRLMQGGAFEAASLIRRAVRHKVSPARLTAAQSVLRSAHIAAEMLDAQAELDKVRELMEERSE